MNLNLLIQSPQIITSENQTPQSNDIQQSLKQPLNQSTQQVNVQPITQNSIVQNKAARATFRFSAFIFDQAILIASLLLIVLLVVIILNIHIKFPQGMTKEQ